MRVKKSPTLSGEVLLPWRRADCEQQWASSQALSARTSQPKPRHSLPGALQGEQPGDTLQKGLGTWLQFPGTSVGKRMVTAKEEHVAGLEQLGSLIDFFPGLCLLFHRTGEMCNFKDYINLWLKCFDYQIYLVSALSFGLELWHWQQLFS